MRESRVDRVRALRCGAACALALALGAAQLADAEEPANARERSSARPHFDARERVQRPELELHPSRPLPVGVQREVAPFRLAPVDPAELAAAAARRAAEAERRRQGEAP
jgi:hypothetical protein